MDTLKAHFSASIGQGGKLHFAAHSHHPWPDVTEAAQRQYWRDTATLLDGKWDKVFGAVIPAAQGHVAQKLSLGDPASIAFAPNTHEFVRRLISCLPHTRRPRILTTDSEFHSFSRQIARLEEDDLVQVTRVPAEPLDSFAARFSEAARNAHHDLVFLSHVFFNSGFVVPDIADIVGAVRDADTLIAIDGYHAFMALPVDLSAIESRVFYIAGGYKYAMAGEGVCFMHCPPGYGPRPRDTGWYAEFGALGSARAGETAYGTDASRFAGSTFDPSGLYRFNAVQDWLSALGVDGITATHHAYCQRLQQQLLEAIPIDVMVTEPSRRGRFLTIRRDDAERIEARLAASGIMTDRRGDRLRLGFGVYHDAEDVSRLAAALSPLI